MRAIRHEDPGSTRLDASAPEPEPKAGEALIRVTAAGLAPIDYAIARREILAPAQIMGGQFTGVVESISAGGNASGALDGKRIVGNRETSCTACDMCRGGLPFHCRSREVIGVSGRDGCLAERFVMPAPALVEIPDALDDDTALFTQPLASALHASQQVHLEGDRFVTVLGDDVLALLCAQVMTRLNATVRLLGADPARYELCEKWGVAHRHVNEVGRRADQQVVIECTGTSQGIELAMDLVKPRGTILVKGLAGIPAAKHRVNLTPLVEREIAMVGSGSGAVRDAVHALARKEYDVLSLIAKRITLDGAVETLTAPEPQRLQVIVEI